MLLEKTVLFLHNGALSCISPFLTLHLLHTGASYPLISLIILCVSLISLLGLPLTGFLLRKCRSYTLVLISNLVVALICYDMLLLLSPGEPSGGKILQVQLFCNGEGSAVYVSQCEDNFVSCTNLFGGDHWQLLQLDNCSCIDDEHVEFSPASTPTADNHLVCFQGEEYNHCEAAEELNEANSILVEYTQLYVNQTENTCNFPARRSMVNGNRAKSIYCIDCNIRCWGKSQVATPGEALLAAGKTLDAVWIFEYILARGVAEMCSFSTLFLLANSNGETDIIATWAASIFSPLSGAFADWWTVENGKETFGPCFYSFSTLMLATIVLSFLLRENHTWFPSILQCERRLFHQNAEFFWFTGVTVLLGALWSYSDLFLPCFYDSLCADKTFIGLTAVAAFLLALPLLLKSSAIIDKLGSTTCIIFAFLTYGARYTGYAFISDVRWSLLIELFRSLCVQLPWLALLHHAARLVPRDLQATAQTLTVILYFVVGRSLGCLVGSYIVSQDSFTTTFMVFAVVSEFAGCVYFAVNLCFFFNKNFDL